MSEATLKLIWLVCCLPTTPDCLAQQIGFVSSWQSGQTPAAVCIGFKCYCNRQTYLIEIFTDMPPLWKQRDKNYHNRDIKPKLRDETGEKLNITGKYWNNNTKKTSCYLLMYVKYHSVWYTSFQDSNACLEYVSYIVYIKTRSIMWRYREQHSQINICVLW